MKTYLYLCTPSDGLIEYNLVSGIGKSHRFNPTNPYSLNGNNVLSLEEEPTGDFWISTDNFTLSFYNRVEDKFYHFQPTLPGGENMSYSKAGLFGEMVTCPLDSTRLWIATRFGLYRFDKTTQQFTTFPFEKRYDYFYESLPLQLFADTQEKILWLGKCNDGLWRYDPNTGVAISKGTRITTICRICRRITDDIRFDRSYMQSIYAFNEHTILGRYS